MLEILINRDIREFKPKFFGPFTFRQAICFVTILLIMLVSHLFQTELLKMEAVTYIPGIILSFIPILFGWGDTLFGMNFEDYAQTVFLVKFKRPKHRPLISHNIVVEYFDELPESEENNNPKDKKKKKKKNDSVKIPKELRIYE